MLILSIWSYLTPFPYLNQCCSFLYKTIKLLLNMFIETRTSSYAYCSSINNFWSGLQKNEQICQMSMFVLHFCWGQTRPDVWDRTPSEYRELLHSFEMAQIFTQGQLFFWDADRSSSYSQCSVTSDGPRTGKLSGSCKSACDKNTNLGIEKSVPPNLTFPRA